MLYRASRFIDTLMDAYVVYYLIDHINKKKASEARIGPEVVSGLSVKSTEQEKMSPLNSAKFLIILVASASLFEWLGMAVLVKIDGNANNFLYMFVNLFSRTTLSIHTLWICMQFKFIQGLAVQKPRLVVEREPVIILKDLIKESPSNARITQESITVRTEIMH